MADFGSESLPPGGLPIENVSASASALTEGQPGPGSDPGPESKREVAADSTATSMSSAASLEPPAAKDATTAAADMVRAQYEQRGYRVHSGLQFGTQYVLYADDPEKVHSDFAVKVVHPEDGATIDWREVQTLVRSMPGVRKHLILARCADDGDGDAVLEELVVSSEHAPFRQKKRTRPGSGISGNELPRVGSQRKSDRHNGGGGGGGGGHELGGRGPSPPDERTP